jgi:regulator of replication initiation timing
MNWETIIPAFVGLVSGLVAPVLLQQLNKRNLTNQTNAEVMNKISAGGASAVNAAIQLLNEFQEDNARLRLEVSSLRTEIFNLRVQEGEKEKQLNEFIEVLKNYIKVLIDILRDNKIEIPPRPDILKESNPKIPRIK